MMDLSQVPLNEYGHVQTRDGKFPAKVIAKIENSLYPYVVVLKAVTGDELVETFQQNGRKYKHSDSTSDLIPVTRKVRIEGHMHILSSGKTLWQPKGITIGYNDSDGKRIACREIDIEVTEGEGL